MKNKSRYFIILFVLITLQHGIAQIQLEKTVLHDTQDKLQTRTALLSSQTSSYDVKYHRLEFEVDPGVHYIKGIVTTYFIPVSDDMDEIYFDFRNNMTIDSVLYHGVKLSPLHVSFPSTIELKIVFGDTIPVGILDSVAIYYQGAPISGGFGEFRTAATTCTQPDSVMWTLSEPYGSKNWWPCKETLNDKADSIDIIINTPNKYRAGSNGVLVNESTAGSRKIYHWHHGYPIPAYLVAFAVADYAVYSDFIDNPLGGQIEVLNYIFHCDSAYAASQTPKLDTIMKFFINQFGQYPYADEKYGHAQCRFGGGMEHSTMSFMGGFQVWLMAHELAHQWFGDKITCGSWHDIWLNEGFATYLEGLTCEQGIGSFSWTSWKNAKINHVTGFSSGSVYNPDTTNIGRIFSSRLSYSKGALLLHMLRWKMGDSAFFSAINNYISDPDLAYDYALTNDLKAHLEAEYGEDLTEFFNDWFYGEGWPDYDVTWSVDTQCNKLKVSIQQAHSTGGNTFFEMPVPIYFSDGSSDTTLIFHQDSPDDITFYTTLDFLPTSATFDPDRWLCAKHSISQGALTSRYVVWEGDESNDWNVAENWDCGIPDQNSDVYVPAGSPQCVVREGDTAVCNTLNLDPGVFIKVGLDALLQVLE